MPSWLQKGNVDVDFGFRIDFQTLLSELMGVCNHWFLESHHVHQDRLPIVLIVLLFVILNNLPLIRVKLPGFRYFRIYQALIHTLLDEIWWIVVII